MKNLVLLTLFQILLFFLKTPSSTLLLYLVLCSSPPLHYLTLRKIEVKNGYVFRTVLSRITRIGLIIVGVSCIDLFSSLA